MKLKNNSTSQKLRGAYYTPRTLADAIVTTFSDEDHTNILEPSCGDGVFIDALDAAGLIGDKASLTAVEINSEELGKARTLHQASPNVTFLCDDFFSFYRKSKPSSYDLILGNPPYIRYQYLAASQRAFMSRVLESQGMKTNKLINAWVGFVVACTNLLSDGGRMAFVLPAELLQVVYAEDLRFFLASHFKQITLFTFTQLVFNDAEQEVVVFSGVKGSANPEIRIIQLEDAASMKKHSYDEKPYQPLGRVHEKWTRYFIGSSDAAVLQELCDDPRLVRLDSMGLINIGITTGNNSYFSIDDTTSKAYDLDEFTLPLLGRSSHASGLFFTKDDWLLNCKAGKRARLLVLQDGQYESLSSKQREYVDLGEANGDSEGYKCSIRESWYAVPSVWVPDAFFLRRNNLFPKFVLNDCGAVSTDTMHRIKFYDGVDPKLALLSYYNSIGFAFTELCGRSYGGGVLEILPKEVGNMLVPKLEGHNLNVELVNNLVDVIDSTIRNGFDIEEALDVVDKLLLCDVLGFTENVCLSCRHIWKTLQQRRLCRSTACPKQ